MTAPSHDPCLLYGATGYTGVLMAERALQVGLRPMLAGRDASRLAPLAARLGLAYRAFGLDDPSAIDRGLEGMRVVLHAAGPFSRTARPMVDGCLRQRAHYLDITGEIDVFEDCAARDAEARDAGVMLLPGTGFDVVPSDCLAAHVAARLPGAESLVLAFRSRGGGLSHGTRATMLESAGKPNRVRRGGVLVEVPQGSLHREVDFGTGPRPAMSIAWGDVATAWRSTGIPDITVYLGVSRATITSARLLRLAAPILRAAPVQRALARRVPPGGPSAEARAAAWSELVAEARKGGRTVVSRLRVGEGYTLTAEASVEIARQVLAGTVQPGFRTPAQLLGADFVLGLTGAQRTDVD